MDIFQVVLVTLVLGKIYEHLEKEGEEEEKQMSMLKLKLDVHNDCL